MKKYKQSMVLELLSDCNLNCAYCMRMDENYKDYKLNFEEVKESIEKIIEFKSNFDDFDLKISGGEPTIWHDGKHDIVDVINLINRSEVPFSLVTNGIVFEKYSNVKSLLDRYFDNQNKEKALKMYISVDQWHSNCKNKGSLLLDNLSKYMSEELKNGVLDVTVQSTVSKNPEENIDSEFMMKYKLKGFKFMINPLLPWGAGNNLKENIPVLKLNSSDKSTLGDYKKYFYVNDKIKMYN